MKHYFTFIHLADSFIQIDLKMKTTTSNSSYLVYKNLRSLQYGLLGENMLFKIALLVLIKCVLFSLYVLLS